MHFMIYFKLFALEHNRCMLRWVFERATRSSPLIFLLMDRLSIFVQ